MGVPSLPCTAITVTPAGMCLSVPGGASICLSYPSSGIVSASAGMKQLLAQAGVALAPMTPFFLLLDAIDKAKNLLFAPDDFFDALLRLVGLVPALTVPVMIADALDILILYLQGLYVQLQAFVEQLDAIADAATKATALGCAPLQLTVDCANAQMTLQMQGISDGVAPLNALISTMNLILGVVPGAPGVPPMGALGTDPSAALAPLQATITALQVVRSNPFFPA